MKSPFSNKRKPSSPIFGFVDKLGIVALIFWTGSIINTISSRFSQDEMNNITSQITFIIFFLMLLFFGVMRAEKDESRERYEERISELEEENESLRRRLNLT